MQQILDIIGAVLFLCVYYFYDVYLASATAGVFAALKLILHQLRFIALTQIDILASMLLVICGVATWHFHDPVYIHWKVSILHILFAGIFYGNRYIQGSSFFQSIIRDQSIVIPEAVGLRADRLMGHFMLSVAIVNYFVFTYYDESTWVYFKSSIFFINMIYLLFISMYLSSHMQVESSNES